KHPRAPGQAGAETAENEKITRLDTSLRPRFVEAERDRGGRGVAVALQIVIDLAARDLENVDGRIDDANIGLVRHVEIDIVGPELAVLEHVLNGVTEDVHSP